MKMTISVPDELRKRMTMIDGMNWSAVASDAFRKVVIDHEAMKEQKETGMNQTIERLRASNKKYLSDNNRRGERDGITWAKEAAEAIELKTLYETFFQRQLADPVINSMKFYSTIRPKERPEDRKEAHDTFWKELAGEDNPSDDYVLGFAKGACSVWFEVKNHL